MSEGNRNIVALNVKNVRGNLAGFMADPTPYQSTNCVMLSAVIRL